MLSPGGSGLQATIVGSGDAVKAAVEAAAKTQSGLPGSSNTTVTSKHSEHKNSTKSSPSAVAAAAAASKSSTKGKAAGDSLIHLEQV